MEHTGRPVSLGKTDKICWFNHQSGFLVESSYDPRTWEYSARVIAYDQPMQMPTQEQHPVYTLNPTASLNVLGATGSYAAPDSTFRQMNVQALENPSLGGCYAPDGIPRGFEKS